MWKLEKTSLNFDQLLVNESLFSLGNGYLGARGCFEEGYPDGYNSIRGTYINGFYDIVDVEYSEKAHGFPEVSQKQPTLIDGQTIEIYLDGEKVHMNGDNYQNYKRNLYFDKGYSDRSFEYVTSSGKVAKIFFKRLISFVIKEVFVISLDVEYDGEILIKSRLDGDISNFSDKEDPRVSQRHSKLLEVIGIDVGEDLCTITSTTRRSRLTVSCSCIHQYGDFIKNVKDKNAHMKNETSIELELRGHGSLNLVKKIVYNDSIRCDNPSIHGRQIIERVRKLSFDDLIDMQKKYLDEIWKYSQIRVYGNKDIQDALRFKLFQLIQSVGKDGISNISAKGLSGEGYEGHYFWDTEIYILPVFQLLNPDIAKSLLTFRYNILEHSRRRARVLDHAKGVKFPWRTISGMECSTYFPAGTAQYHINGDIAYGVIQHYLINEDLNFIMDYGAEIIFETARTWVDLGHFKNEKFRIDAVTGPDEYTAIVNNNYYTNAIAKYNLYWAAKFYEILQEKRPDDFKYLLEKLELDDIEINEFRRASKQMYLPYDDKLKINMQDDTFLNKEVWDFANTPKDKYPLLLNYHPLNIYRKQVLKQADTVLAHMLLEDYTDNETIKNSYDYYEKITTHDSSLSSCIYGIMASKNGDREKACKYFNETLKLDLENTHGNTKDGLHMANLAGSLLSIIMGFAGLRIKEKGVCLNPLIPEGWEGYSFNFHYRGSLVNIHIDEDVHLELISGNPFTVAIYGETYILSDVLSVDLKSADVFAQLSW